MTPSAPEGFEPVHGHRRNVNGDADMQRCPQVTGCALGDAGPLVGTVFPRLGQQMGSKEGA